MTDFALQRPQRRADPGPVRRFFLWLASDCGRRSHLRCCVGLVIVARDRAMDRALLADRAGREQHAGRASLPTCSAPTISAATSSAG